jgi:RNA polymerase sigma factor for flagellar operon FliA
MNVPADIESLITQQQPGENLASSNTNGPASPQSGGRGLAEGGHAKAARRAYTSQNKKPLDENQIAQYLPLVHKIAQRAASYLRPPLTYDDLVSAGTVGLVKAAKDYDTSYNAEFQTYAYIRIKGAILDELRGWAFIPPNVNKQIRRTMDLSVEITKQTGVQPTETELAEKLGLTTEEVYETLDNARVQQFLSIDRNSEENPSLANILSESDARTPDENLQQSELIEKLSQSIQQLNERQRQVILLYYQQHLTMKQIAEVFKITEPRVSQLHASALFNLSVKLRQYDDSGK